MQSTVSADSLSNRSSTASDRDSGDLSHVNASAYKDDDVPASSGEHDKHEDKDNEDQTVSTVRKYSARCLMNLTLDTAGRRTRATVVCHEERLARAK